MDPNAALRTLREMADDSLDGDAPSVTQSELAEQVRALDEWLSKGGFPPEEWQKGSPTVDMTRTVPEGEVKALVAIEAAERLINRARRVLMSKDEPKEWALLLLEQAAEITTNRTCTAVKSLGLSHEISVKADDLVAPAVQRAREIQKTLREERWAKDRED